MKHMKKIYAVILVLAISVFMFAAPVAAKNSISEYQSSVVCIGATIRFKSANFDISFTVSGSGTGFGVGKPGDDVQYIATCAHVVDEPSGIYSLYINTQTGAYTNYVEEAEGTYYPTYYDKTINGVNYTVVCDYFSTETTDLYALFSNSSNDYINLTVAQINKDVDLALCKLASAPTDKISALPIQRKTDVDINTDILAIGYPSTSKIFDAENRLDSSSSTIKDGIISKFSRTNSMSGSKTTFDVFEVTAELTTGMSGGPVISEESGSVVGVTSFGYTDVSQAASARYAICIDYLIEMLDRESVAYVIHSDISPVLIIGIVAGVLILIALIVIIVFMARKKPAKPQPVSAPPVVRDEKKYYLLGISGPLSGRKFGVTTVATIGRDSSGCNITFPIDQPGVSSIHCEVRITNGVLTLKDCGSSYGTFLENGIKLEPHVAVILSSGSRFYVGAKNNMFEVKY